MCRPLRSRCDNSPDCAKLFQERSLKNWKHNGLNFDGCIKIQLAIFCFSIARLSVFGGSFHWGINGHPLSQSAYYDVALSKQLDLVTELGAGWYRVDIEEKSFFAQTARFDELLAEAKRRGISLLPVLLISVDNHPSRPIHEAAFAFGRAIAQRYRGQISHWELGNEWDIWAMIRKGETTRNGKRWEWDAPDGSEADHYEESRYQMAKAAIEGLSAGVKQGDPKALTIVNTAGWLHFGFIERLANEDRVLFDLLAWHWYSEMGDITRVQGKFDLVKYLKRFGRGIWITEINRRGGSADGNHVQLADYLKTSLTDLRKNEDISAVFLYELLDEPALASETSYGLLEATHPPTLRMSEIRKKPAFQVYKEIIKAAP